MGGVVSFLVLGIAGLRSHDPETVRAAYIAMNLIGEYAIVPLSLAAFVTGIVQALGTPWGLFRYYWIVVKLVLTIGGTLLLLLHQFTAVREAAVRVLSSAPGSLPDIGHWRTDSIVKSGAAILLLLAITAIAIYKPWGVTPYGRAKLRADASDSAAVSIPRGLKVFLVIVVLVIAAFLVGHLTSRMHHGQ